MSSLSSVQMLYYLMLVPSSFITSKANNPSQVMKEDILCRCYTAAAFLDNLRTYTYFSNFLDPSPSGSGMFKLQDSNLHQSQRKPINIPYYTKTRGGIPQFCCHLENTINRKCLDADLCSTKKI